MPLFVRAGSILLMQDTVQSTAQKPDHLDVRVYGGRDAECFYYDDDGISYNYEKGAYSTITFNYDEASGKLTIGDVKGSFDGMLKSRTFNIVWVGKQKPVGYDLSKPADATVAYEGKAVEVTR
jgi:alpha-D-xyloside xylohydrolase